MKPRILISAVTAELATVRSLTAEVLLRLGYDPVSQEIFGTEPGDLRQMLRKQIGECEGLIHIVGHAYGAEPPSVDPDFGRVSYTQFEFLCAKRQGIQTWVLFAEDDCTRDTPTEQLDLPPDTDFEPDASKSSQWQAERQSLQNAWRQRLRDEGHLHHRASNDTELELKLERLKNEFAKLRRADRTWRRRVNWALTVVVALGMLAVGIGAFLQSGVGKLDDKVDAIPEATAAEIRKLLEDPDVLTGTLKSHIRQRAKEQIADAGTRGADWRVIDKIEKRREAALERVDDVVTTIREGLTGDPDPIFATAARILAEQGVDEALRYLDQKEPEIKKRVNGLERRRDQAEQNLRDAMGCWMLKAELHETNLAFEDALPLYHIIVNKTPTWSRAQRQLGTLLTDLAEFNLAETHLQTALQCSVDDSQRQLAARHLGFLYLEIANWPRAEPLMEQSLKLSEKLHGPNNSETAINLNNLGRLLHESSRFVQAEVLLRRALAIDLEVYGPNHSRVAIDLNNLAGLLQATNRLEAAEAMFRAALSIDEQTYGSDHLEVARELNNLAELFRLTDRHAITELLYRRALTINEQLYGPSHPATARVLSNLALFLKATNRPAAVEQLLRRALAIDEQARGPAHPEVAIRLSNMASFLKATNRYAIAEPLSRRALAIDKRSLGPMHPSVGRDVNNLASLFHDTGRLAEAELLYRVALKIDEAAYGPDHSIVAGRLNNLAMLFRTTNRLELAEQLMLRSLVIHERCFGATHPGVAMCLNNLGVMFNSMERFTQAETLFRRSLAIEMQARGNDHPLVANRLDNLAGLLQSTDRVDLAEPLARRALAISEAFQGSEHPDVAYQFNNLATLLKNTKRLSEAEPFGRRAVEIFALFGMASGKEHPHFNAGIENYKSILKEMNQSNEQIKQKVQSASNPIRPLEPLARNVEDVPSAAGSVSDVLTALDNQYRDRNGPSIYFLPLNEPIAPHVHELRAKNQSHVSNENQQQGNREPSTTATTALPLLEFDILRLDVPIAPHLDALLGPTTSLDDIFLVIDNQEAGMRRNSLYDVPPEAPIEPLLDEFLEPAEFGKNSGRTLTDELDEILGPIELTGDGDGTVTARIEQLLGAAPSANDVLASLDEQSAALNRPTVWFLSLDEEIGPHLDTLLGRFPNGSKQ